MVAERIPDEVRIREVIDKCIDPEELWHELEANRAAFSEKVVFDGGFELPAMLSATSDLEDFVKTWKQRFPPAIQQIRNALVHARESRQSTMIAPTRTNEDRLFPWLGPLSFTAASVMLYSSPSSLE